MICWIQHYVYTEVIYTLNNQWHIAHSITNVQQHKQPTFQDIKNNNSRQAKHISRFMYTHRTFLESVDLQLRIDRLGKNWCACCLCWLSWPDNPLDKPPDKPSDKQPGQPSDIWQGARSSFVLAILLSYNRLYYDKLYELIQLLEQKTQNTVKTLNSLSLISVIWEGVGPDGVSLDSYDFWCKN